MTEKEFKINDYITLKLESGKTNIYVNEQRVYQCRCLLLDIPVKEKTSSDSIGSIDEVLDRTSSTSAPKLKKIEITPEEEFWGYCSNLQVWVENDYDTKLLHRTVAFSILEKLHAAGVPIAQKVFKKEIIKRLESNYQPIVKFLVIENYLKFFDKEEIRFIFLNSDGSFKDYIQTIMEDSHAGENLFYLAKDNLKAEDFLNLCFDNNSRFKPLLKKQISGRIAHSKLKDLVLIGGDKAKYAINQEIMNFGYNLLISIKGYDDIGYESFFSLYSDEEIGELFYDQNNQLRDWVKRYITDKFYKNKIGYSLMVFLYTREFKSVKEYFKRELENGDEDLLLHLDVAGIFRFFTLDELEDFCFNSKGAPNPWFAVYFEDKTKNEMPFNKISNRGFSLLKKMIKKGSSLAKREFIKQIEKEHIYTKTLSRQEYEQFGEKEFHDLCIDKEGNIKPWLIHLVHNDRLREEYRFPPLKILADSGIKKAKDEIFKIYKNDFSRVKSYFKRNKYDEIFTEDERKELFEFNGIRELFGSRKIGEFRINDYLVLKLEDGKTNVYVGGELFRQCKCLFLNTPKKFGMYPPKKKDPLTKVENIDVLWDFYSTSSSKKTQDINDFWGFCSNIQVWAEHDYDLTLLISEVSIPLLKKLKDAGDPIAGKVFKKEMEKNLDRYLDRSFVQALSNYELVDLFGEFVRLEGGGIILLDNDVLDLRDRYITKLDDVKGFEKLTTLKKLWLGMTEEYYELVLEGDYYNMQIYEDEFDSQMLSNLNGLGLVSNLEELNLNNTRISDVSAIKKLKNLRILEFTNSKINNLKIFLSCINLKKLNLKGNHINEIEDLSVFENLEELNLASNGIGKIKNLNLPNLKELDLRNNNIFVIENLEQLKELRRLSLPKNSIEKITGLDNLNKLQTLHLGMNKIGKVDGLQKLTNLQELKLFFNQITEINLDEIPKNLKLLSIRGNKLKNLSDKIGNLGSLTLLDMRNNQLENLPETIGNLKKLEILRLYINKIKTLPNTIGQLTNLKKLNLYSNSIHELPESIGDLKNLIKLNVRENKLTKLPKSIGQMKSLEKLLLNDNPLKELPKSVIQLKNLRLLNLNNTELQNDEETRELLSVLLKNKVLISFPEQIPIFETKDIKVRGIEKFTNLNIENWKELNSIAWDKQIKQDRNKESARSAYYLMKLGRRTGSIEIYCHGLDIFAITIENSNEIEVLKKAREFYREINSINTNYSSDSDLTDIDSKIKEVSLFGKHY